MENEEENPILERVFNTEIKRCFAMHCKNNCGGNCNLESTYILVNGMCDNFRIRSKGDTKCS